MNSIVFLGTAGDIELMARQQRASGGIILNLGGNQFHLDPGPGSLAAARDAKVNPRATLAIIATNNALLRSGDVDATVAAMTLGGLDKHGILLGSKSVIEGTIRPETKRAVEGLVSLEAGQKIGINEVTLWPVRAHGRDQNGVGLKLGIGELLIGYTSDTSWYEGITDDYSGCRVLLLNVKHPAGTREEGFLSMEEAEQLIAAVKPKLALLTSFGSKLSREDLRDLARQMQRHTKADVTAAKDGQQVGLPKK